MRHLVTACLFLCLPALAQPGMGGDYTTMDVKADEAVGNFMSGRFDSLVGDVRISLRGDDPAADPMVIESDKMDFSYAGESTAVPVKIVLTGNVHIPNPDPNVRSVRSRSAVWSFATNVVTFRQDVRLAMASGETMTCQEARVDLATGDLELSGVEILNYSFSASGRTGAPATDPSLLREGDIADWKPLVAAIKAGLTATDPSPALRVVSLLDNKLRTFLESTTEAQILEMSDVLLKEMNKLLARPDFYDAPSWEGIDLGDEAKELLALDTRDAAQTTRLNRLLMEAAWPAAFAGG